MSKEIPFRYQLFILKLSGYQLSYSNDWKGFLMHTWGYISYIVLAIGAFCAFHAFLSNLNNITIFTEALATSANSTMCFIRVATIFNRRHRLRVLIKDLREATEAVFDYASDVFEMTTKRSLQLSKLDIAIIGTSIFNLLIKSLYIILFLKLRIFPFRISFFFDLKQPILFETFFFLCCILAIFLGLTSLGPSILIYAISNNIKAHFRVLHKRIKSLKMDGDEESVRREVTKFMEYQRKIEAWVIELNDIYLPITNAMSIYYALLICNIGFQIVVTKEPIKRIHHLTYGAGAIFALFLYMQAGDHIRLESMKLATAIWESDWWKAPLNIQRDLIFVIRRCQKPFLLKGLFFEVTLDTFTNIMNAAGSYVALLMSFLD